MEFCYSFNANNMLFIFLKDLSFHFFFSGVFKSKYTHKRYTASQKLVFGGHWTTWLYLVNKILCEWDYFSVLQRPFTVWPKHSLIHFISHTNIWYLLILNHLSIPVWIIWDYLVELYFEIILIKYLGSFSDV